MGLDCWVARQTYDPANLTDDEGALFAGLDLPLCEWTARGGSVHFAGKRYLAVVERVAGVCLSEAWIAPETMAEMARRFAETDTEATVAALNADDPGYQSQPLSLGEVTALRVLFEICAAAGLGLANDW
jgi:hypothetical protein